MRLIAVFLCFHTAASSWVPVAAAGPTTSAPLQVSGGAAAPASPALSPGWQAAFGGLSAFLASPAARRALRFQVSLKRLRLDLSQESGRVAAEALARHLPESAQADLATLASLPPEQQAAVLNAVAAAHEQAEPGILRRVGEVKQQGSRRSIQELAAQLGKDRKWLDARADQPKEVADLHAAARLLEREGIQLNVSRILVSESLPRSDPEQPIQFDGKDSLHVSCSHLKSLAAEAVEQGLKPEDRIAHAILSAQLRDGAARALRFDAAELKAAGLGSDKKLTAVQAARLYRQHWLTKLEALEQSLDRSARDTPRPAQEVEREFTSAAYDPRSRLLFTLGGGRIEWRTVRPDGSLAADPSSGFTLLKEGESIRAIAVDSARGRLIGIGDGRVVVWSIVRSEMLKRLSDQRLGNGPERAMSQVLLDPVSGSLITAGSRDVEVRRPAAGSDFEPEASQTIEVGDGSSRAALALDSESRTLFVLERKGWESRIVLRRLDREGRIGKIVQTLRVHNADSLAWDPEASTLAVGRFRQVQLFRLLPEGRLAAESGEPLRLSRADGGALAWLPGSNLLSSGGSALLRYDIPGHRKERELASSPRERLETAEAVAAALWQAPRRDPGLSRRLAEALLRADDQALVRAVWHRFSRGILGAGEEVAELAPVKGSERWFPGADRELGRRMPTLRSILEDPARLGRLLYALSFLRMVYPYHLANHSEKTALGWARELRHVFPIRELRVLPVGESFRRHIFGIEDEQGIELVELKMPGEMLHKREVNEEHFTAARELWEAFPDDPLVVKPLHYRQFKGKAVLYGSPAEFDGKDPLGVMLFRYQLGKRWRNGDAFVKEIAKQRGLSEEEVELRALEDMAVFAIRFHRLGWSGDDQEGPDMHDENVAVTAEGRGLSAADFGAAHKAKLTPEERADQTLTLLGHADRKQREAIYPNVLKRIRKGVEDAVELKRIEKEVKAELGLDRKEDEGDWIGTGKRFHGWSQLYPPPTRAQRILEFFLQFVGMASYSQFAARITRLQVHRFYQPTRTQRVRNFFLRLIGHQPTNPFTYPAFPTYQQLAGIQPTPAPSWFDRVVAVLKRLVGRTPATPIGNSVRHRKIAMLSGTSMGSFNFSASIGNQGPNNPWSQVIPFNLPAAAKAAKTPRGP